MNLVNDPWLPVVDMAGRFSKIGLRELFSNGKKYSNFVLPVGERIAIMRFLLCLIYDAIQVPQDYCEWHSLAARYEKDVLIYLSQYEGLFNLFDPVNPFLQILNILPAGKDGKVKVDKLNMNLASGTCETLFDNHAELREGLSLDQLARSLITIQSFALNGLTSQIIWDGQLSNKSGDRSSSFGTIHAFLIGQNIHETLFLNVLTKNESPAINQRGEPAWKRKPHSFEEAITLKNTFMGTLLPYRRAVSLSDTGSRMAFGIFGKEEFYPDPYLSIENVKENRKGKNIGDNIAKFREGVDFWRQFGGVLFLKENVKQPIHIRSRREKLQNKPFDLWLGVIHAAPGVNSKIISVSESSYHFSYMWADEDYKKPRDVYENWIGLCLKEAQQLRKSIWEYLDALGFSGSVLQEKQASAESLFWSYVSEYVPIFLNISTEEELDKWNVNWPSISRKICEEVKGKIIQPDSPRSYRAWAKSNTRKSYDKK